MAEFITLVLSLAMMSYCSLIDCSAAQRRELLAPRRVVKIGAGGVAPRDANLRPLHVTPRRRQAPIKTQDLPSARQRDPRHHRRVVVPAHLARGAEDERQ